MINPYKIHRVKNALVKSIGHGPNYWCEFSSKGTTFGGWIDRPKFTVGDRVNLQVQFSITMDKYIVKTANLPRVKKAAA